MSISRSKLSQLKAIISKELKAAHWTGRSVFSNMYGFIGGKGEGGIYPESVPFGAAQKKEIGATFKPIEVLTDFNHLGGDEMLIPIHYPFTESMVYGDLQKKGTGETKKLSWLKVKINAVSKVAKVQDGLMGEQLLKQFPTVYKRIQNAKADLIDIHQRWQGLAPYDALTKRWSNNIYLPTANGGLGETAQSHPNFYVAGSGKVAWNATPATYETAISTALNGLTDVAGDRMSIAFLENMIAAGSTHKIRKANLGSGEYYVIVITSSQARQLKADSNWQLIMKDAFTRDPKINPLFTGKIEGFLSGAYIVVDDNAFGAKISGDDGYDATLGTVNYGNANPLLSPIDTAPKKLAYLLGASAIGCGHAMALGFEDELDDFKTKKEVAAMSIIGYGRSDIYDLDGHFGTKGAFLENTSSLIGATYSPNTLSW